MFDKKKYYQDNKAYQQKMGRERMARTNALNLNKWEGFIPKETKCQVCGMKLIFNSKNKETAIHFDHRKNNIPIKISPTHWLRRTERNKDTENIWNECDFGILCCACNLRLPTDNREEFIKNAYKYVLGGDK